MTFEDEKVADDPTHPEVGSPHSGHPAPGGGHFPRQPHLVPPLEPESFLRKDLRPGAVRRAGAAFLAGVGRAVRHYRSQCQTWRCFARTSATLLRPGETEPGRSPFLLARPAGFIPAPLDEDPRLVHQPRDRGGKISASQLSREPALWR